MSLDNKQSSITWTKNKNEDDVHIDSNIPFIIA